MNLLNEFSPTVEQLSIDEAFLDVSHDPRRAREIGEALQFRVQTETGLPCSLGIATNKLVAKIATGVGKGATQTDTYPNSIQIVPPGKEAEFLAPLPTRALWGVGPRTADQLAKLGIHTIGQIARWSDGNLESHFGQVGPDLARRARGEDSRSVSTGRESKSISQEVTFWEDISDEIQLIDQLRKQSQRISESLQRQNLLGSTIKLKMRWPDFSTITRQTTLANPTDNETIIFSAVHSLFKANWKSGLAVRLLGVGVSGISEPDPQLSLWDAPTLVKQADIDAILRDLHKKFGDDSVQRGMKK
jgi:DNA polymerase-4